MLGKVALGARTPGEVFARVIGALPHYCSHEQVSVERRPGQYRSRAFRPPFRRRDAARIAAIRFGDDRPRAGDRRHDIPCFGRLDIPPHPAVGVAHLRPGYGDRVVAAKSNGITVTIDERVVERPYGEIASDRLHPRVVADADSLRSRGTLSNSLRVFLALLIESDQSPTLARVAAAAGMNGRSLQRRLEAEETSFSELLAEVRRAEALKKLKQNDASLASIASDLGYSDQTTFTRAFRRWTHSSPGRFRKQET